MEDLPSPVHVFTAGGRICYTNRAFDEMFGSPRGVFIGQHVALLNPSIGGEPLRALREILSATASNGFWKGPLSHQRWDGSAFQVRALVCPATMYGHRFLVCMQAEESDGKSIFARRSLQPQAVAC